jgi:hypothetical protein
MLPESNWPKGIDFFGTPYGWACQLTRTDENFDGHRQKYRDIVRWILATVENPNQNVLWTIVADRIYLKFRKEKDMTWFQLRWP